MPAQKFSFEAGGPKRVEVRWGLSGKQYEVFFDGARIGELDGAQVGSAQGATIQLPDGSTLGVLLKKLPVAQLQVSRDGKALPGSAGDPATQVRTASIILYAVAIIGGGLGLVAMVTHNPTLQQLSGGGYALFGAAIYAVLGFFTSKRSRVALALGMGLYALDSLFTIAGGMEATGHFNVGGLLVRAFFFYYLWRGMVGLNQLRREAATSPTPSA